MTTAPTTAATRRCVAALRVRAASQRARCPRRPATDGRRSGGGGVNRPVSEVECVVMVPVQTNAGAGDVRQPPRGVATAIRTYWTVILPFMFIARCGVQWKSYEPAGTPANEIV